jgi:hypothetical protein
MSHVYRSCGKEVKSGGYSMPTLGMLNIVMKLILSLEHSRRGTARYLPIESFKMMHFSLSGAEQIYTAYW